MKHILKLGLAALCLTAIPASVSADQPVLLPTPEPSGCGLLPDEGELTVALIAAVAVETSGLDFQMWATLVDRDGVVCAVAFSGRERGSQHREFIDPAEARREPGRRVGAKHKTVTPEFSKRSHQFTPRPLFGLCPHREPV